MRMNITCSEYVLKLSLKNVLKQTASHKSYSTTGHKHLKNFLRHKVAKQEREKKVEEKQEDIKLVKSGKYYRTFVDGVSKLFLKSK